MHIYGENWKHKEEYYMKKQWLYHIYNKYAIKTMIIVV